LRTGRGVGAVAVGRGVTAAGFGVARGNGDESRVHTGGGVGANTRPSPPGASESVGGVGCLEPTLPGRVDSSFNIESRSKSLLPLTALGLSTPRPGVSSG